MPIFPHKRTATRTSRQPSKVCTCIRLVSSSRILVARLGVAVRSYSSAWSIVHCQLDHAKGGAFIEAKPLGVRSRCHGGDTWQWQRSALTPAGCSIQLQRTCPLHHHCLLRRMASHGGNYLYVMCSTQRSHAPINPNVQLLHASASALQAPRSFVTSSQLCIQPMHFACS